MGCGGNLSPKEYISWAHDEAHGLRKSKTLNNIRFEVQYKPAEYIIAMESKGKSIQKSQYDKRKKELEGMEYFDFRIYPPEGYASIVLYGLSHPSESQSRLNYFSFGMQQDLSLEFESGRNSCKLYHFERASDMAPHRTFVLGFPRNPDSAPDLTFVYNGQEFNTGPVKLKFEQKDLSNLPQIALQ